MIDYIYADLYYADSINKQLNIEAEDGTVITNTNIYQESMSIEESLCSESTLTFGCCETSTFTIKIANQFTSLYGQKLIVSETIDGNTDEPFQFGIYKVVEDTPTADRIYRNITAYDAMYDIINADATEVAEWYNELLPDKDSTVTMYKFRTSFMELFGIEQENTTLINEDMVVEKTVSTDSLSGKDVICAICEINGCFGHIGRDGKFQYIYLNQLSEPEGIADVTLASSNYKSCDYEDYTTLPISKLKIRQEEGDVGATYGSGDNCYIIEGNFLVYGKDEDDLTVIAKNIYNAISGITYRPTPSIVAVGNPCVEVGDSIFLSSKYQDIGTYVLQRTLKGIQALEDTYEADGTESYENSSNSLESTISQLKGKANVLTRTIDETKSQITNVEEGLTSVITQTVESFETEISEILESVTTIGNTTTTIQEQVSTFEQTLDTFEYNLSSLESTVTDNYEYTVTLVSEFQLSLDGLTATASSLTEQVGSLQTEAVTNTVTEYYKSTSSTECVGGEWAESTPDWEDGTYIWVRTTVTTGTGSSVKTTTSDPVCITGNTGASGSSGNNGASVTISSTEITYQASASGTDTPTGEWAESVPEVSQGEYLWTRTVVNYTLTASDGATSVKSTTSYSVAYIGADGEKGEKGDTGEKGEKGATGADGADGASVTIQSTKVTYQATSSGTETPSGSWSESVPEMEAGQYLWTRTVVTYLLTASDGSTSTPRSESAASKDDSLRGTYTVTAQSGLNIRDGAGSSKAKLVAIPYGTAVQNYGYYTEAEGVKWLYITFVYGGVTYTGFGSKQYLAKS